MSNISENQQELIDNFNLFDNWMDKYEFLIDLGKKLPDFPEEYKIEQNLVRGCQSKVWFYHSYDGNNIKFIATSDSAIICGLIYLLLSIYSEQSPHDIVNTSPDFIAKIGLDKHLSPTRKNGLFAMLTAIKNIAIKYICVK